MGYVVAIIVVVLLVAGFVTFLVFNATRGKQNAEPDRGAPATEPRPGEADAATESERLADRPR